MLETKIQTIIVEYHEEEDDDDELISNLQGRY